MVLSYTYYSYVILCTMVHCHQHFMYLQKGRDREVTKEWCKTLLKVLHTHACVDFV